MHYRIVATVRFKKSVLEPQGQAVMLSLQGKGHESVRNIRVGRYIELEIEAKDEAAAMQEAQKMAEEILYNPVMEVCELKAEQIS